MCEREGENHEGDLKDSFLGQTNMTPQKKRRGARERATKSVVTSGKHKRGQNPDSKKLMCFTRVNYYLCLLLLCRIFHCCVALFASISTNPSLYALAFGHV